MGCYTVKSFFFFFLNNFSLIARVGRLQGYCEISTNEGGCLEMTFDRGVAHGPARRFSPEGALQWTGRYRHGVPHGACWRSNDGEGWYAGTCGRSGRMAGGDVVYLYPDLRTALVGRCAFFFFLQVFRDFPDSRRDF